MCKRKALEECKSPAVKVLAMRKLRAENTEYAARQRQASERSKKSNRERRLKWRRDYYMKRKVERIMAEINSKRGNLNVQ